MPLVEDFGARVRLLREQLRLHARDVARAALDPDATEREIADYADAISKLERGERGHMNPTLDRIRSMARGFGFGNVPDFLMRLDRVMDYRARPDDLFSPSSGKDLQTSAAKPDNPSLPPETLHGAAPVVRSASDVNTDLIGKIVFSAAEAVTASLGASLDGLGGRVAEQLELLGQRVDRLNTTVADLLSRVDAGAGEAGAGSAAATGGKPHRPRRS